MITVLIIKKKKIFKNIGDNIPGGIFLAGSFPGRDFLDTVYLAFCLYLKIFIV